MPDLGRWLLPEPEDTRAFGVALGALLRAGDVVLMAGGLGAGKTTLTQGIAAGMQVRGPITSPTFVIARVHPSLRRDDRGQPGPGLVHVDAYRLGGAAELTDLDLDANVGASVTVVEWGRGIAEELGDERLEITVGLAAEGTEERAVRLVGVGPRWDEPAVRAALTGIPGHSTDAGEAEETR